MCHNGIIRGPGTRKGYPKEYYRPISSQHVLNNKFAKMSLKPSQREALRILVNPKTRATKASTKLYKSSVKASTKQYKSSVTSSSNDLDDKFAKMRLTTSQSVPDSRILYEAYKASPLLYRRIKNAVELMRHLESHKDDKQAKSRLQLAELHIEKLSLFFESLLPSGWKYDRDTVNTLFA